jgi:hypothetical protein
MQKQFTVFVFLIHRLAYPGDRAVCGRFLGWIAGSNLVRGTDVCLSAYLSVANVVFVSGRGLRQADTRPEEPYQV